MSFFAKKTAASNGSAHPEVVQLPAALLEKIKAHKEAFARQVQAIQAQSRQNIELMVDGYASSLDLPADTKLEYNHDTCELRLAPAPAEITETA